MKRNRPEITLIIVCLMALACLAVSLQGCGQAVIGVSNPHPGWQITRPFDMVMALAVDRDTVWVGTKNGVYAVDRKTGTVIKKLETDPPLDYVKALLVGNAGELYIGHFNGLTVFDANGYRTYTKKDGLPDNRVNALLEDRDGRLWVGTWGGIGILENGKWRTLTSADGLITDMVNVMLQDSSGGMWFGSMVAPRGGISYLKDGTWQLFSTNNGLPHNNINAMIEDNSGNVWVGTGLLDRGGAVCFAPTEKGWSIQKVLLKKDGLAGEKVRSIFQDKDGVMWFGSEYDGIARFENGKWRVLNIKDGLPDPEVMAMFQDVDGNLWLGTQLAVIRLSADALNALKQGM